ncbi:MAG: conjugal transfer protein TraG, partial [Hyphomonadaceae bacterium]
MGRTVVALLGSALIALAGLWLATAFIADVFAHQRALGAPLVTLGDERIYAPWAILAWTSAHAEAFPRPFAVARLIVFAAFVLALLPLALAARGKLGVRPFGAKA